MSNQQTFLPLNPITLPLNRNALIEASAGTGKTYTITTLYLRALLGLIDGENTPAVDDISATDNATNNAIDKARLNPLTVEQILVVTFTEAATQEIRDRVRVKLKQVQDQILGVGEQDSVIAELLEEYCTRYLAINTELEQELDKELEHHSDHEMPAQDQAMLNAYHVLQNAITLIDEASIFTIHGFCHRCLKQFAFETNASFEQNFEMDNKPTLFNALLDFWRKHVVELNDAEFEWFSKFWKSPDALYRDLSNIIGKDVTFEPKVAENDYQALMSNYLESVNNVKQAWLDSNFGSFLTSSHLVKTKITVKRIPTLQSFVTSDRWVADFGDSKTSWHLWGTESLSDPSNFKKGMDVIEHPMTSKIDALAEAEDKIKQGGFKSHWLQTAKLYIESRAKQFKTEQQIINPDDLLIELAGAISNTQSSDEDTNRKLVEAITQRYPLAFIDEFQDTDPIQYKIFSALYGDSEAEKAQELEQHDLLEIPNQKQVPSANMILIGDPKQAIYKFRGADIFTYIQAKQDIPNSQHYTLDKNWRSHPHLVTAVNYLFNQNEQGFRNINIPFINVDAAKPANKRIQLLEQQTSINDANIEFWHLTSQESETDPKLVGFKKAEGEPLMANWAAQDIAKTLDMSNQGLAGFANTKTDSEKETETDKPKAQFDKDKTIRANDICVLVRNRSQANIMKKALSKLNISSVFISRNNVFESDLAKDLLRLLTAIESPFNEQKVRSACAGGLFGYSAEQLLYIANQSSFASESMLENATNTSTLNDTDTNVLTSWQQHLAVFQQSNEYWQKGQIAKALNSILQFAQTFKLWQQDVNIDAERLITDFRHLTELLQQESVKIAGCQKLLLWFEKQVTATDAWASASEEQQLRLESDNQLVQIATLHASKGLEYPIVYLPFICDYREEKTALFNSNKVLDGSSSLTQGLTYRVDNRLLETQIAEEERLAEDLRLLYVAMTRPVYKLVFGIYDLRNQYKKPMLALSAAGQLLLGNDLEKSDLINDELIGNVCQKFSYEINQLSNEASSTYVCRTDEQVNDLYIESARKSKNRSGGSSSTTETLNFSPFNGKIASNWRMLSYSSLAAQHSASHQNSAAHQQSSSSQLSASEHLEGINQDANDAVSGEAGNEQSIQTESDLVWQPGVSDEIDFVSSNLVDGTSINSAFNSNYISSTGDNDSNEDELVLSPFTFPKGANAGSCLHWMMENLDFCQPVEPQKEVIVNGLERFGLSDIWTDITAVWLQHVIDYPLSQGTKNDFSLSEVGDDEKLVEMEFYFSFTELNTDILSNALLMSGISEPQVNKELGVKQGDLTGILKGFIDLTVMNKGKYYVIDYKSNYLGDNHDDYNQENLHISMSDHSYYLQAVIYAFALHLFLKQRLQDYDYETHVGGALYLFLRGMQQDQLSSSQGSVTNLEQSNGVFHVDIKFEVIEYLEQALAGKSPTPADISNKLEKEPKNNVSEQLGFGFE